MKISILKVSSSKLKITINSSQFSGTKGTVKLSQYFGKDNFIFLSEELFVEGQLEYAFNLSNSLPRDISECRYVIEISTDKVVESSKPTKVKFSSSWQISGMAKKIRYDFYIASKNLNGGRAYIFKKLFSDIKCLECWDSDLESSNDSNCPSCGGSGVTIAYSKPLKVYAGPLLYAGTTFDTGAAGKELVDRSARVTVDSDLYMSSDDVIYYVKTGEYYRVDSSTPSLLQSELVTQQLVVQLLPSNSFQSEIPEGEL